MKKYWELFLTFLKISAFTFGGGYAMISVIEHEVAEKRGWLTKEEFLDVVAVAESTPGPLAINSATFVGTKTGGFLGAFFATLGVVVPPFVIISILSRIYGAYGSNPYVEYAFFGVRAAVLALLVKAVRSLSKSCKKDGYFYVLMPIALAVSFILNVPVLAILAFGAFCGILWGRSHNALS